MERGGKADMRGEGERRQGERKGCEDERKPERKHAWDLSTWMTFKTTAVFENAECCYLLTLTSVTALSLVSQPRVCFGWVHCISPKPPDRVQQTALSLVAVCNGAKPCHQKR